MRWIFARRLASASAAGLARTLNDRGVPSPAAYDPARNRHRNGNTWTLRTVAAILANPRYTGRQVWNRQRIDHHEAVPGDKRTSTGPTRAWNPKDQWVISTELAHPALVSDTDFLTAQGVTAISNPKDRTTRVYALTGLLLCALCGRRLQAHWVHGRPGYRCRHGQTSAHQPGDMPRWIYWPEKRIVHEILEQLSEQGVLPHQADTEDLFALLHKRDAIIVCDHTTLTMDDPTKAEPAPVTPVIPAQRTASIRPTPPPPATAREEKDHSNGAQQNPHHNHPR